MQQISKHTLSSTVGVLWTLRPKAPIVLNDVQRLIAMLLAAPGARASSVRCEDIRKYMFKRSQSGLRDLSDEDLRGAIENVAQNHRLPQLCDKIRQLLTSEQWPLVSRGLLHISRGSPLAIAPVASLGCVLRGLLTWTAQPAHFTWYNHWEDGLVRPSKIKPFLTLHEICDALGLPNTFNPAIGILMIECLRVNRHTCAIPYPMENEKETTSPSHSKVYHVESLLPKIRMFHDKQSRFHPETDG
jgi:hypothetical protein